MRKFKNCLCGRAWRQFPIYFEVQRRACVIGVPTSTISCSKGYRVPVSCGLCGRRVSASHASAASRYQGTWRQRVHRRGVFKRSSARPVLLTATYTLATVSALAQLSQGTPLLHSTVTTCIAAIARAPRCCALRSCEKVSSAATVVLVVAA